MDELFDPVNAHATHSRRVALKAAAWSVPAVALTAGAPAASASPVGTDPCPLVGWKFSSWATSSHTQDGNSSELQIRVGDLTQSAAALWYVAEVPNIFVTTNWVRYTMTFPAAVTFDSASPLVAGWKVTSSNNTATDTVWVWEPQSMAAVTALVGLSAKPTDARDIAQVSVPPSPLLEGSIATASAFSYSIRMDVTMTVNVPNTYDCGGESTSTESVGETIHVKKPS